MATNPRTFQDIIDEAAAKVFCREFGGTPNQEAFGNAIPRPPNGWQELNDIMREWERADASKPNPPDLPTCELGLDREITAVPASEQRPSVEPRAPVQHQWGALFDRCDKCGLTRELVEDFAPDCGDPVGVRDAVIAAMCRALDAEHKSLQSSLSGAQALATSLQRMTESYERSCVARDQLRSRVRILEEDNARLKTELDRHPWARRMVR